MGRRRAASTPSKRSRSPRPVVLAPRQPRETSVPIRATIPGPHRFWDRKFDSYMTERRALAKADAEHPEAGPSVSRLPVDWRMPSGVSDESQSPERPRGREPKAPPPVVREREACAHELREQNAKAAAQTGPEPRSRTPTQAGGSRARDGGSGTGASASSGAPPPAGGRVPGPDPDLRSIPGKRWIG